MEYINSTKYHIEQLKSFKNLETSLKDTKQIEPIIVFIDNNNIEHIVDGVKRAKILTSLNMDIQKKAFKDLIILFKFILDSKEIYDSSIWKYIHILKENEISEEDIFSLVLKGRLKISTRDIWKLLNINYSSNIYNILTELNMDLKELILYHDVEQNDFISLLNLFKSIGANKNNRKDLFNLMSEITKRENLSLTELVNQSEFKELLESNLQKNDKISLFKKMLFNQRYPNMSKEIEVLTNLKSKIKTPGLKLDLPIDKESKRTNISFQFRNYKELEKKVKALQNLLNDEYLKEVLSKIENR